MIRGGTSPGSRCSSHARRRASRGAAFLATRRPVDRLPGARSPQAFGHARRLAPSARGARLMGPFNLKDGRCWRRGRRPSAAVRASSAPRVEPAGWPRAPANATSCRPAPARADRWGHSGSAWRALASQRDVARDAPAQHHDATRLAPAARTQLVLDGLPALAGLGGMRPRSAPAQPNSDWRIRGSLTSGTIAFRARRTESWLTKPLRASIKSAPVLNNPASSVVQLRDLVSSARRYALP